MQISFKKAVILLLIIFIAVILIAFILTNRSLVALNLNIFAALLGREDTSYSFTAPFFVWLFLFLLLGAAIGRLTALPKFWRYEKQIKMSEQENGRLKAQLIGGRPHQTGDDIYP